MKNYILIALGLFLSSSMFSQEEILTIGIGSGLNSFNGDVDFNKGISPLTSTRSTFFLNVEKRLTNTIGLQLDISKGNLSVNERSTTILNNRNFESDILKIGTNFLIHLDNDKLIKKSSPFSPYISLGFSYLGFSSYSDYYDANNDYYHYWDDGSIRDVAQSDTASNTNFLYRDYNYETLLEDSNTTYARNTFCIPVALGFKWKLSNQLQVRLFASYNYTFTDWIDNVNADDNNDVFTTLGFSVNYVLRKVDLEEKNKYLDINLDDFSTSDEDGDGVYDLDDLCHRTKSGIEVDKKGCPLDSDNDGVADYLDKEPNTKPSVNVDEEGRELTDSLLKVRIFIRDSMETERIKVNSEGTTGSIIFKEIDVIEQKFLLLRSCLITPKYILREEFISKHEEIT